MSRLRPVHRGHGQKRQVCQEVLGCDPVPGNPKEPVIQVRLQLRPTCGISCSKCANLNDSDSTSYGEDIPRDVLEQCVIRGLGTNQKNVSCSSTACGKKDSFQ